jgi:hypothetical protein
MSSDAHSVASPTTRCACRVTGQSLSANCSRLISNQNRCQFCIVCQGEYARQAGDRATVDRTLRDGVAGDARLDAALEFLTAFAAGPQRSRRAIWTVFVRPGPATRRSATWRRSASRSA